jgi:hypothetical protein
MLPEMKELYTKWRKQVVEVVKANPQRSYQDIGKEFGVTGSYVGQLAKLAGVDRQIGAKATKKDGK